MRGVGVVLMLVLLAGCSAPPPAPEGPQETPRAPAGSVHTLHYNLTVDASYNVPHAYGGGNDIQQAFTVNKTTTGVVIVMTWSPTAPTQTDLALSGGGGPGGPGLGYWQGATPLRKAFKAEDLNKVTYDLMVTAPTTMPLVAAQPVHVAITVHDGVPFNATMALG